MPKKKKEVRIFFSPNIKENPSTLEIANEATKVFKMPSPETCKCIQVYTQKQSFNFGASLYNALASADWIIEEFVFQEKARLSEPNIRLVISEKNT